MGCNQPGVEPCEDAKRLALLTDFAVQMKEKLDQKDAKYPPGTRYTLVDLMNHLEDEYNELKHAFEVYEHHLWATTELPNNNLLRDIESECIDVANMAFIIREECLRIIEVNDS